jgi:uncharacterized protein involved in copper resistance
MPGMSGMDHSAMPGMNHGARPGMSGTTPTSMQGMVHGSAGAMPGTGSVAGMAKAPEGAQLEGQVGVDNVAMMTKDRLGEAGGGLDGNGRRTLRYTDLRALTRGKDPRPPSRDIVLHLTGNMGGLRTDLDSSRTRNWASFDIQGLAPYFFEVELTGYVSPEGRLAGRAEVSYDLLITNRLILQPQVEFNFYSRSDPARGNGTGLSEIDAGLRLRYEFSRQFAPYIGVGYEGKFGQTAKFARQAGDSTQDIRVVAGVRIWF